MSKWVEIAKSNPTICSLDPEQALQAPRPIQRIAWLQAVSGRKTCPSFHLISQRDKAISGPGMETPGRGHK